MAEVNNFYVEQNTVQSVTSTAWTAVPGTTIAGSSLVAGTKYLLVVRAKANANSTLSHTYLRVMTSDSLDVQSKSYRRIEAANASTALGYFFVHSFTTSGGGASDVFLQARADSGITIQVDQASIMLIDLDDLGSANYFESIQASTGLPMSELSGSPDTLVTIAGSDLGTTEDWLLLGLATITAEPSSESFHFDLRGANDASTQSVLSAITEEGEDSLEQRVYGFAARHKAVTSNVDAVIEAWGDPYSFGNYYDKGAYLIALKGSAFADFEFAHEPASVTVPYFSSSTTLATVGPYTPTTSGSHLVIGWARSASTYRNINVFVEKGGVGTRTGDNPGTGLSMQTQGWDGTDCSPMYSMETMSITSSATYTLEGNDWSASLPSVEHRWLIVLNLNLAGVGGTAHTVDVTETVGVTDTTEPVKAISVEVIEPIGVADVIAPVKSAAATLTESVTTTDTTTTVGAIARELTDPVTTTDTTTPVKAITTTITDPVDVTDTTQDALSLAVTITDAITTTDTTTLTKSSALTITDPITTTDTTTRVHAATRSIIDPVDVTDTVTTNAGTAHSVTITESVTTSDLVTRVSPASRILTDSIATTDAVTAAKTITVEITDAVTTTDSTDVAKAILVGVTDPVTTTDLTTRTASFFRVIDDGVDVLDPVTRIAPAAVTITDLVVVTDATTGVLTVVGLITCIGFRRHPDASIERNPLSGIGRTPPPSTCSP